MRNLSIPTLSVKGGGWLESQSETRGESSVDLYAERKTLFLFTPTKTPPVASATRTSACILMAFAQVAAYANAMSMPDERSVQDPKRMHALNLNKLLADGKPSFRKQDLAAISLCREIC
jgi:hypothetical protein